MGKSIGAKRKKRTAQGTERYTHPHGKHDDRRSPTSVICSSLDELFGVSDHEAKLNILRDCMKRYQPEATEMQDSGSTLVTPSSGRQYINTAAVPLIADAKDAFAKTKDGKDRKSNGAVRKAKSDAVKSIHDAIQKVGNTVQQFAVLKGVLQRKENKEISQALKHALIMNPNNPESIAMHILKSLSTVLKAASKHRTNDSQTFLRTVFVAMAPLVTGTNNRGVQKYSVPLNKMAKALGFPPSTFKRRMMKAAQARATFILEGTVNDTKFVQHYKRKCKTKYTPELIEKLHHWLLNDCDNIIQSPNASDCIYVPDPTPEDPNNRKKVRKYYYRFSVAEVHNELMEKCHWAKDDDGEAVVSDTMLRNLMPRQIRRLTDSQKQMCGCEICIIAKSQTTSLNAWRSKHKTALDQRWTSLPNGRAKNKYKKEYEQYCREAFPNGAPLWPTQREAVASIGCPTVGDTGLHHIKCALGHCDNCPDLFIPKAEKGETDNDKMISFHVYEYHTRCKVHGPVGNGSSCPICQANKEQFTTSKGLPKVSRKLQLTLVRKPIGLFHKEYYHQTLLAYLKHIFYVALLGKHWCVEMRLDLLKWMMHCILTQRDYADRLLADFNLEIQSTHFGLNMACGMEGSTSKHWNLIKEEMMMHYYSFIQDGGRQDARTTYLNTIKQIEHIRANQPLFLSEGTTLFEIMDGCAKQYRCANALFLMSVIAKKYGINVDRMIQAAHHGKGDVDSQNGLDKNLIRAYMRVILTPEVQKEMEYISAHTVENGRIISFARRIVNLLSNENRKCGRKTWKKSQKRELAAKIVERYYFAMHHGDTDQETTDAIPIENITYQVVSGFAPSFNGETSYGLASHYHIRADAEFPVGTVAVRRLPCGCRACYEMLSKKWVRNTAPEDQPRYQDVPNCRLREILGNYNNWKIVRVAPKGNGEGGINNEEEIDAIFETVLESYETRAMANIEPGSFAAYETEDEDTDGYYIVRFLSSPFALESPQEVEGVDGELEEGAMVARGEYWNPVHGTTRWYRPYSQQEAPPPSLFRVRYVMSTKLEMVSLEEADLPNGIDREVRAEATELGAMMVEEDDHQAILEEIAHRSLLDYEEVEVNCDDEEEEEEEEDEEEQEEDEDETDGEEDE